MPAADNASTHPPGRDHSAKTMTRRHPTLVIQVSLTYIIGMESFDFIDAERPHVLLAGDTTDLQPIRRILSELPPGAYGQVYLEIVSPIQIRPIPTPEGVSLTWLRRDLVPHGLLEIAPRGELIRRAITAWVAEWMPEATSEAPSERADRIHLWIGCNASPRVGSLYRELASRLSTATPED